MERFHLLLTPFVFIVTALLKVFLKKTLLSFFYKTVGCGAGTDLLTQRDVDLVQKAQNLELWGNGVLRQHGSSDSLQEPSFRVVTLIWRLPWAQSLDSPTFSDEFDDNQHGCLATNSS
ncbi:hypothetical protein Ancab_016152, partial [Ancistrocladus abbreviatus]